MKTKIIIGAIALALILTLTISSKIFFNTLNFFNGYAKYFEISEQNQAENINDNILIIYGTNSKMYSNTIVTTYNELGFTLTDINTLSNEQQTVTIKTEHKNLFGKDYTIITTKVRKN